MIEFLGTSWKKGTYFWKIPFRDHFSVQKYMLIRPGWDRLENYFNFKLHHKLMQIVAVGLYPIYFMPNFLNSRLPNILTKWATFVLTNTKLFKIFVSALRLNNFKIYLHAQLEWNFYPFYLGSLQDFQSGIYQIFQVGVFSAYNLYPKYPKQQKLPKDQARKVLQSFFQIKA